MMLIRHAAERGHALHERGEAGQLAVQRADHGLGRLLRTEAGALGEIDCPQHIEQPQQGDVAARQQGGHQRLEAAATRDEHAVRVLQRAGVGKGLVAAKEEAERVPHEHLPGAGRVSDFAYQFARVFHRAVERRVATVGDHAGGDQRRGREYRAERLAALVEYEGRLVAVRVEMNENETVRHGARDRGA